MQLIANNSKLLYCPKECYIEYAPLPVRLVWNVPVLDYNGLTVTLFSIQAISKTYVYIQTVYDYKVNY